MLKMSRVIIFSRRMATMEKFYSGVLGLQVVGREKGWVEMSAGECSIALHKWTGDAVEGPIKIVFFTANVEAHRRDLMAKGATMGKVVTFGDIQLCDTSDPDGNAIQISSRKRTPGKV